MSKPVSRLLDKRPIATDSRKTTGGTRLGYQTIRDLCKSGVAIRNIVNHPAWEVLMDRIDSNIKKRTVLLDDIVKRSASNRSRSVAFGGELSPSQKLSRLEMEKQNALNLLNSTEFVPDVEAEAPSGASYEAYRRRCWLQYYEWLDSQAKNANDRYEADQVVQPSGDKSDVRASNDDELEKMLLGLD